MAPPIMTKDKVLRAPFSPGYQKFRNKIPFFVCLGSFLKLLFRKYELIHSPPRSEPEVFDNFFIS